MASKCTHKSRSVELSPHTRSARSLGDVSLSNHQCAFGKRLVELTDLVSVKVVVMLTTEIIKIQAA